MEEAELLPYCTDGELTHRWQWPKKPKQRHMRYLWSSRVFNVGLPSPTQGLPEGWEWGGGSGERGLSGAGEGLEVTPGDETKSAVGRDWGHTDHSYAVLNQFRCSLCCEPTPGYERLICSYPPASWTLLWPQSTALGRQTQLSRIVRQ